MKKKTLGFDIDGVLYFWHTAVYEYLCHTDKYFGTYEQFWSGDYKKLGDKEPYGDFSNVTWFNLCHNLILYDRPEHVNMNAVKELQKLAKEGHSIVYITARNHTLRWATMHMLDKYGFPFPENFILADKKDIPIIANNVDIFVEDHIKNGIVVAPFTQVLIRKQLWNEDSLVEFDTIETIEEIRRFL